MKKTVEMWDCVFRILSFVLGYTTKCEWKHIDECLHIYMSDYTQQQNFTDTLMERNFI